uniref:Uncharacterized protein n=1 Tax=Leptocylindrus danicus TaxID=163516 RepID=A0A7S2NYD7_9STRA|mmetsp:Transcript_18730/g.27768  ORF Transcript_18730/g.27768 Transcript_18730/m.27768 type:complete len:264 (+) Transcript_18730:60-851(+)
MLIPSSSHELMQFLCHRTDWKYETRREERPRIQRTVGEFIASHSGYEKSEYWRKIAEQSNDTPVGVILSSLLTFVVFLREKTQDPRIFSNDAVLYYEELRRRFPDLGFCSSPVEGLRLVRSTSVQYINTVKMTLDNCCAIGGKGTNPAHPSYSNDLARLEAASAPTARGYKLIALLYCMSESGQNLMPFLSSPAFEPNIALSVDGLPCVSRHLKQPRGINDVHLPQKTDAGIWMIPFMHGVRNVKEMHFLHSLQKAHGTLRNI